MRIIDCKFQRDKKRKRKTHAFLLTNKNIQQIIYKRARATRDHVVCLCAVGVKSLQKKMASVSSFLFLVVLFFFVPIERGSGLPMKMKANGE